MGDFYIKAITVKGKGKTASTVIFHPGLNIIRGRSNTGKTVIIKCIDYCFGCKKPPFDKGFGYTTVEMNLHTGKGEITISRNIGKNQVNVTTTVSGFVDGKYDINPQSHENKHPVLSDLLLYSIGIEERHMIVKNVNFDKQRLTWRTFLSALLFHSKEIANDSSVIEPIQSTEKTAMLSSLLFLLTGRDFSESEAQTKKDLRLARTDAVKEYIDQKLQIISRQKEELLDKLKIFNGANIENIIQDQLDDLHNTEGQISAAVEKDHCLLNKIMELQDKSAEFDLLQSRYSSLKTQYASDIRRLSFIVNGEANRSNLSPVHSCPFCDGEIPRRKADTFINSAQSELSRIIVQMSDLESAENDLMSEITYVKESLMHLNQERAQIEFDIEKKLKPKATALKQNLSEYRTFVQIQNEIRVIDELTSKMINDVNNLPDEKKASVEYHPKEYFENDFNDRLDEMFIEALKDCNYKPLNTAHFNIRDFDIEVNEQKKAHLNGLGYCSFLNSITAVVFRSYIEKYAKYNPGFVVIDTPLLGLDQGVSANVRSGMRTGLYEFFIKHQSDGQIIVLENMRHLPDIDFEKHGAHVISFTKNPEEGRYGFLEDVRE